MAKAIDGIALIIGVITKFFKGIKEESKRPLGVGISLHDHEPFGRNAESKSAFHVLPGGDVAVVHEEEGVVGERVAVCFGEVAFGGGADVGED